MRVVIAEDLTLLREGLSRLLGDRGWEIVAAVDDGPKLVDGDRRAPARHRRRRRAPAAVVHRRGHPRGDRGARARARHADPDPLPVRRGELRAGPARRRGRRRRLPAQGPRRRRAPVRRVAGARGGGRHRHGPRGGRPAAGPPRQPRAAVGADAARARGAHVHGRGALEHRRSGSSSASPRARSRSTSSRSSPSSTCRPRARTTAACWPCWPTWEADRVQRRAGLPRCARADERGHGPAFPTATPLAYAAAVLTRNCEGYPAGTTGLIAGAKQGCLVFAPDEPAARRPLGAPARDDARARGADRAAGRRQPTRDARRRS